MLRLWKFTIFPEAFPPLAGRRGDPPDVAALNVRPLHRSRIDINRRVWRNRARGKFVRQLTFFRTGLIAGGASFAGGT